MLCQFCLFLSCVRVVFNSGYSDIRAPRASAEPSITIFIGERELVSFLCLCHHPQSHFTKLITRALV